MLYLFGRRYTPNQKKISTHWCLSFLLFALLAGGCATNSNQSNEPDNATEEGSGANASGNDPDATVVSYDDYSDPLIGFNRAIFAFNDVSYRYALIPLSKGYIKVVPEPARRSVGNFFYNIKMPIYFVNNSLQLKPKAAGTNLLRFGINTTLGVFGLFDPAKSWFDIERADTSVEDTLAQYGVGYGAYVVIPLLGPSDLRNGTSTLVEGFMHPIAYLVDSDRDRFLIQGFDYFQEFAPSAEQYPKLKEESEDPYLFFRNLYLQGIQRDADYQ